jgi:catechol 2,3-dioxygenase-like lactoylglutathione lyase family enzyme
MPENQVPAFHHVGLRVRDLDRAIEWYGEAFGFELQQRHETHTGVRVAFVRRPSGERLELFELMGGDDLPDWPHPDQALTAGYAHFALHVEDIEAAFGRAAAAGARVLWRPRHVEVLGASTSYLADADNNLIELVG